MDPLQPRQTDRSMLFVSFAALKVECRLEEMSLLVSETDFLEYKTNTLFASSPFLHNI